MTTDISYEPEIRMHRAGAMFKELFFCDETNSTQYYSSDFEGNSERTVDGERQHALFEYNDSIVVAYGLLGEGDSATTVFSFHSKSTAKRFYNAIVVRNEISAVLNETQVICCSEYGVALEQIGKEQITQLHYCVGELVAG